MRRQICRRLVLNATRILHRRAGCGARPPKATPGHRGFRAKTLLQRTGGEAVPRFTIHSGDAGSLSRILGPLLDVPTALGGTRHSDAEVAEIAELFRQFREAKRGALRRKMREAGSPGNE